MYSKNLTFSDEISLQNNHQIVFIKKYFLNFSINVFIIFYYICIDANNQRNLFFAVPYSQYNRFEAASLFLIWNSWNYMTLHVLFNFNDFSWIAFVFAATCNIFSTLTNWDNFHSMDCNFRFIRNRFHEMIRNTNYSIGFKYIKNILLYFRSLFILVITCGLPN